mgnify:CR=1 FL=1
MGKKYKEPDGSAVGALRAHPQRSHLTDTYGLKEHSESDDNVDLNVPNGNLTEVRAPAYPCGAGPVS